MAKKTVANKGVFTSCNYEVCFAENNWVLDEGVQKGDNSFFLKTKLKRKSKATEDFVLRVFSNTISHQFFFADYLGSKNINCKVFVTQQLQCKRGPPLD